MLVVLCVLFIVCVVYGCLFVVFDCLFFDFPNDINAVDIEDQYMLGDELMVAPILAYQQRYRNVYFPGTKDDKWISFWDDQEAYTGGLLKEKISAPIDIRCVCSIFSRV